LDSLVEIFKEEYNSSPQIFDNALMQWRGMLILLQFDQMLEWEWNQLLISVLKQMYKPHETLRIKD
jgi:hypothetical protein